MKNYCVYELRCPLTNDVKYIGSTSRGEKRFDDHLRLSVKSTKSFIKYLFSNENYPYFAILKENLSKKEAMELERTLTLKHESTVLNIYCVNTPPQSIIDLMSSLQKGKCKSEITKQRMKEAWIKRRNKSILDSHDI